MTETCLIKITCQNNLLLMLIQSLWPYASNNEIILTFSSRVLSCTSKLPKNKSKKNQHNHKCKLENNPDPFTQCSSSGIPTQRMTAYLSDKNFKHN